MRTCLITLCIVLSGAGLAATPPEWYEASSAYAYMGDYVKDVCVMRTWTGAAYAITRVYVGSYHQTLSFGDYTLPATLNGNAFIARQDTDGSWLWAKRAGTLTQPAGAAANSVAQDENGNIYITGSFAGDNCDFGDFSLSPLGNMDCFIAKLDILGNWIWVRQAGGDALAALCGGTGIALDASANVYVTGYFDDVADFGPTHLESLGENDLFVAKLDTNGNWIWAKRNGDAHDNIPTDICLSPTGNAYICGRSMTATNGWDVAVSGINSAGTWLGGVFAGGSGEDCANAIVCGSDGFLYLAGRFFENAFFGSTELIGFGSQDAFIAKLNPASGWVWAKMAGGDYYDEALGIDWDPTPPGYCYVTGSFFGPARFGFENIDSAGATDAFVAKVDANGFLVWVLPGGGQNSEKGVAVRYMEDPLSPQGFIFIAGQFANYTELGPCHLSGQGDNSWDIFGACVSNPQPTWIPRQPLNPLVYLGESHLFLAWDPVTQDTNGYPLSPSHYRVERASSLDGPWYPLEPVTPDCLWYGNYEGPRNFYRIKAVWFAN